MVRLHRLLHQGHAAPAAGVPVEALLDQAAGEDQVVERRGAATI
jgi:hypothetical protein